MLNYLVVNKILLLLLTFGSAAETHLGSNTVERQIHHQSIKLGQCSLTCFLNRNDEGLVLERY